MKKVAFLKYLRSVHPVGLFLSGCGVLAIAFLVPLIAFSIYMRDEPSMVDMQKDLKAVQLGIMKPSRSGSVPYAKNTMYVTRAADKALTVLWPYGFAHDDNYFEGYLFSDTVLKTDKVTVLAPTRYTTANRPWMTHLRVDRTLGGHWYHVQGEMYK